MQNYWIWVIGLTGASILIFFALLWLYSWVNRDHIPLSLEPPDDWKRLVEAVEDVSGFVDHNSDTYQAHLAEQQELGETFNAGKRERITQFVIEEKKRNYKEYLTLEARREQRRVHYDAAQEKVALAFYGQGWVEPMAVFRGIHPANYQAHQELTNTVFEIAWACYQNFDGAMPFKKSWRYCIASMDLPYWAKNRRFFERLCKELAYDGVFCERLRAIVSFS
jgi:hypothetical protein